MIKQFTDYRKFKAFIAENNLTEEKSLWGAYAMSGDEAKAFWIEHPTTDKETERQKKQDEKMIAFFESLLEEE